jgi:tyrosinase
VALEHSMATDSDHAAWAREPFLFFVDADGRSVRQSSAGDYAEIGLFDYDYAPGSGEEIVPATPVPAGAAAASRRTLPVRLIATRIVAGSAAGGAVVVPLALVRQQAEPREPKLFASVTVRLAPGHHDVDLFIDRADGTPPIFVATLLMFGHHVMHGPVAFLVPLSAAFAKLQASRPFDADPTLNIRILARPKDRGQAAMPICVGAPSEITAISIEQL